MKEIDYLTFKKLLHIKDDDFWYAVPDSRGQGPYRIADGTVRAVPLGMTVDTNSREPVRPLIRDINFSPDNLYSLDGELDELEPWNPTGKPDAVLFKFPASVDVVSDFLTKANLWWNVDKVLWQEYGLPDATHTRRDIEDAEANLSPAQTMDAQLATQGDDSSYHAPSGGVGCDLMPDPHDDSWRSSKDMELIERRIRAISWLIADKEYQRMQLQQGEKREIDELCRFFFPDLFKPSSAFAEAWKLGSKRRWWRVENYSKYMKNRS